MPTFFLRIRSRLEGLRRSRPHRSRDELRNGLSELLDSVCGFRNMRYVTVRETMRNRTRSGRWHAHLPSLLTRPNPASCSSTGMPILDELRTRQVMEREGRSTFASTTSTAPTSSASS